MTDLIDIDRRPTIPFTFEAHVAIDEAGRPALVPINPAKWLAGLLKMAGPVWGELRRPRKTRSQEASNYTWGVIYVDVMIALRERAQERGEEPAFEDDEELHDAMKWNFFGPEIVTLPDGSTCKCMPRTRKLDSKRYAEFVDYIRRFWAERGVYTRDPGEDMRV